MEKPQMALESIPELRRLVQEPVEYRNDLTGKLYGSRVSIFITRFFLKRGWSANVASFLMLANGLTGSALLIFPGWWQVVGFFLLETYYLFDCVDGELARYYRTSHLKAAYYDYLAHVLVKSAMFLGLGVGLARCPAVGHPWPIFVAMVPTLAILFTKVAADVHHVIFTSKFILSRDEEAIANFMRDRPTSEESREAAMDQAGGKRRLSSGMVRELLLNFDLYLILFMVRRLWTSSRYFQRPGPPGSASR